MSTGERLTVAVLAGGRSSEHEVSLSSGEAVRTGLREAGHEVLWVEIDRDGSWRHAGEELRLAPAGGLLDADVAFPVLHGPYGEDGTVQGVLETLDVAFVGAGVTASALCLDKVIFKELMGAAGIPQVDYVGVRGERWRAASAEVLTEIEDLGLPVFVKPAHLGSSVGIAKVTEPEDLRAALDEAFRHDTLVIVEAMAEGAEVECAVLGRTREQRAVVGDACVGARADGEAGDGAGADGAVADASAAEFWAPSPASAAEVSQPGEITFEGDWYDYAAKYTPGGMELLIPARICAAARAQVRELALEAFAYVGCEGLARVDFFVAGEQVLVNELNTMPGFTPTSVYAKLAAASGVAYPELVERLCRLALERHAVRRALAH